jgi:hypothetical protein
MFAANAVDVKTSSNGVRKRNLYYLVEWLGHDGDNMSTAAFQVFFLGHRKKLKSVDPERGRTQYGRARQHRSVVSSNHCNWDTVTCRHRFGSSTGCVCGRRKRIIEEYTTEIR